MPKRSAKDRKRIRRMINDELKKTGRTKAQRKRYAKQQQQKKATLYDVWGVTMRQSQHNQFNDVMILLMFAILFLYSFVLGDVYVELAEVSEHIINCQCQ